MDAFLVSTGIVALAEIGDKTQLLAFLLAARFRRPLPIVAGIFVATIANHAFAAAVGALVSRLLGPDVMRWVLGIVFLGMAAWVMVPDKVDEVVLRDPPTTHDDGPQFLGVRRMLDIPDALGMLAPDTKVALVGKVSLSKAFDKTEALFRLAGAKGKLKRD